MMTLSPIRPSHHRFWHDRFLQLLPGIQQYALLAFRHLRAEAREDAVAEVVANTLVAFVGLVERGKMTSAYATVLARYGVARYREGRRVGTRTNTRDIMSPAAQRRHGIQAASLDSYDPADDCWETMAIEDRTAGPAAIACFRIDFVDWLRSLSPQHRRLAADLATGETTSAVARKHRGLTQSRLTDPP